MPEEELGAAFGEVARAWRLTGAPAGLNLHIHESVHRVDNERAWKWLNDALNAQ